MAMRARFAMTILLMLCITAQLQLPSVAKKPKGVVLFLLDDVGSNAIGSYGGTIPTPAMDRMARTGVKFEHFFSQPLCAPTRASVLSGRYPFRHGITENIGVIEPKDNLPKEHCLLGRAFKQAGYATAVVQKFGVGREDIISQDCGFDHFAAWLGAGSKSPARFYNTTWYTNIKKFTADTAPSTGFERWKWFRSPRKQTRKITLHDGDYSEDIAYNVLESFTWRRLKKDVPFFFYYPMVLAHEPFDTGLPPGVPMSDDKASNYAHMVEYADHLIGRYLDFLEHKGVREDVLVGVVGDNGVPPSVTLPWSDVNGITRDVRGGKFELDDSGTRVPALFTMPGTIPQGGIVADTLGDVTDLLPTLADAVNADLSDLANEGGGPIDGVSLWADMRGADAPDDTRQRRDADDNDDPDAPCPQVSSTRSWTFVQNGNDRFAVRSARGMLDQRLAYQDLSHQFDPGPVLDAITTCPLEQAADYNMLLKAMSSLTSSTPELDLSTVRRTADERQPLEGCSQVACDATSSGSESQPVCVECKDGYRQNSDGHCVIGCKDSNCDLCRSDDPNTCVVCRPGFGPDDDGMCRRCQVNNCRHCFVDRDICDECQCGFQPVGNGALCAMVMP